jgi:hypothetical protein
MGVFMPGHFEFLAKAPTVGEALAKASYDYAKLFYLFYHVIMLSFSLLLRFHKSVFNALIFDRAARLWILVFVNRSGIYRFNRFFGSHMSDSTDHFALSP